jgi:hypothetical protein
MVAASHAYVQCIWRLFGGCAALCLLVVGGCSVVVVVASIHLNTFFC